MEVLFLILKIIGICLLVLLGIFLFLVLSIMFVPVRYRIRGKGEIPKPFETEIRFRWFFHIIYGRVWYGEEGAGFKVRLFGIPLRLGSKKSKKSSEKTKTRKKTKPKEKSEIREEAEPKEKSEIQEETEPIEKSEIREETELIERLEDSEKSKDSGESKSFGEHKNIFHQKVNKIKYKIQKLKEKFIQLKEQLGNIKIILSEETNRNAVAALFREFKYIMKHYTSRNAFGELQFGTDDPANTGQILGIVSLFPFWHRYKISVTPDFAAESIYAKGELFVKGHIRSVHLLISGIRLIKNKDIRKLINQIRK